jgi:hypothetical protein
MTKSASANLSLDEEDDAFVLKQTHSDGTVIAMRLSDEDLMSLAQSAPTFAQKALSKHTLPDESGMSPVIVTEVVRVGLHGDALGENILLTLFAPSGANQTYALSDDIVDALGNRLPAYLVEMRQRKPRAH